MRITLNLATRPFTDLGPALKRLRLAIGALAVVAIGLGLGLHAFHQKAEETRAREHSLDAQIVAVAKERQGFQDLMHRPDNAQLLAHAAILNQLFDEKSFSWTLAMEDLETVLPGGVQVSTIEPIRGKDGQITLHLRVIGPRDRAVELVKNLEHSKHFLLPRIVGENAEVTGGPGEQLQPISASSRVNFDLLAEYNPATPGETHSVPKSQDTKTPDAKFPDMEKSAPAAAHASLRAPSPQFAHPSNTGSHRKPSPLTKPNTGGLR